MYDYVQCTKCGRKLDTGLSCPNGCNKEQNFNSLQQLKAEILPIVESAKELLSVRSCSYAMEKLELIEAKLSAV